MPPPPSISGGEDYWSGNTNQNADGNSVDLDWRIWEIRRALGGEERFISRVGGYRSIYEVVNALEQGWMTNLTFAEWRFVIDNSSGDANLKRRACKEAREAGVINRFVLNRICPPPDAPIPGEMRFILGLSFLVILFLWNAERLSKSKYIRD